MVLGWMMESRDSAVLQGFASWHLQFYSVNVGFTIDVDVAQGDHPTWGTDPLGPNT